MNVFIVTYTDPDGDVETVAVAGSKAAAVRAARKHWKTLSADFSPREGKRFPGFVPSRGVAGDWYAIDEKEVQW